MRVLKVLMHEPPHLGQQETLYGATEETEIKTDKNSCCKLDKRN